jgi:hypothetical protein
MAFARLSGPHGLVCLAIAQSYASIHSSLPWTGTFASPKKGQHCKSVAISERQKRKGKSNHDFLDCEEKAPRSYLLVGTALELSTMAIDSRTDTTTFRMLPSTLANFDKMADVTDNPGKGKLFAASQSCLLVTNAHCAYIFLCYAMPDRAFLDNAWVKISLKGIISKEAAVYINCNRPWALKYPNRNGKSSGRFSGKSTTPQAILTCLEDLNPCCRTVALSMVDSPSPNMASQYYATARTFRRCHRL